MVVDNLNVESVASIKPEANAKLVIDADAVLSRPVAGQGFQSVIRRNPQILKVGSAIQHRKFPKRHQFNICESWNPRLVEQRFRVLAAKRSDHLW